ncbi:hypothetical protein ACQUWX_20010, partial [Ralstonia pseudosolanacearum]
MTSPTVSDAASAPIRTVPIAAIATAPGRGGIGVVRVSGPDVRAVMQAVCGRLLPPRQATYLPFLDADGAAIDRGIALWFPAPHSYTGEDVLELQYRMTSAATSARSRPVRPSCGAPPIPP